MLTGDREGDLDEGAGSNVDKAAAPVSPRSSAPRLLEFCRGRGIPLIGQDKSKG